MVSQMSCRSFVLLIMDVTAHVERRCICPDMFCCEFYAGAGVSSVSIRGAAHMQRPVCCACNICL